MVKEYKIIEKPTIGDLEDEIFCCLSNGWQPLGGVSVDRLAVQVTYLQAMVKFAEPPKKKTKPAGLNPDITYTTKGRPASQVECVDYCMEIGMTTEDGFWFWERGNAADWKRGEVQLKDWKAHARTYKHGRYFPSQKGATTVSMNQWPGTRPTMDARLRALQDDLRFAQTPEEKARIQAEIEKLKGTQ